VAANRIEMKVNTSAGGPLRQSRITVLVERRSLTPRMTQPSVLIANLPSPGLQPPRTWMSRAGWDVRLKRYRRIRGPVRLTLTFERTQRSRLDILTRCVVDLLTATNLIEGDDPNILKELALRWGAGSGLQILIEPWSEHT
jgi:hypothetical protein